MPTASSASWVGQASEQPSSIVLVGWYQSFITFCSHLLLFMTPMLTRIHFKSASLLCHVNTINAHPMHIQFDSLRMRIKTGLQRASCKRALRHKLLLSNVRQSYILSSVELFYSHRWLLMSTRYTRRKAVLEAVSQGCTWFGRLWIIHLDWLLDCPQLAWLRSRKFKPYDNNRVTQILENTSSTMWRHVSGSGNPEHCSKEGLFPSELIWHSLWWNRPVWLTMGRSHWSSCSSPSS